MSPEHQPREARHHAERTTRLCSTDSANARWHYLPGRGRDGREKGTSLIVLRLPRPVGAAEGELEAQPVDRIAIEAFGEDSFEGIVVTVLVNQLHAPVPPVQHMIDRAGFDRSGGSWHRPSLSCSSPGVNISDVPFSHLLYSKSSSTRVTVV